LSVGIDGGTGVASASFFKDTKSSKSIPAASLFDPVNQRILSGGAVVANTTVFADDPKDVR
jgi:hypothetical protein